MVTWTRSFSKKVKVKLSGRSVLASVFWGINDKNEHFPHFRISITIGKNNVVLTEKTLINGGDIREALISALKPTVNQVNERYRLYHSVDLKPLQGVIQNAIDAV